MRRHPPPRNTAGHLKNGVRCVGEDRAKIMRFNVNRSSESLTPLEQSTPPLRTVHRRATHPSLPLFPTPPIRLKPLSPAALVVDVGSGKSCTVDGRASRGRDARCDRSCVTKVAAECFYICKKPFSPTPCVTTARLSSDERQIPRRWVFL
jgi:hypothetical protein